MLEDIKWYNVSRETLVKNFTSCLQFSLLKKA